MVNLLEIKNVKKVYLSGQNNLIFDLRKREGLSQAEMGEKLGLPARAIDRIEKAQMPFSLALVKNIQALYGWSYDYIIDQVAMNDRDGLLRGVEDTGDNTSMEQGDALPFHIQDSRLVYLPEVNDLLQLLRQKQGFSQAKMGEKLRVDRDAWARMEKGKTPVCVALAHNIKMLYGWSYEYIIDREKVNEQDGVVDHEQHIREGAVYNTHDESIRIKGDQAMVVRENSGVYQAGSGTLHATDVSFLNGVPDTHREEVLQVLNENKAYKKELRDLKEHYEQQIKHLQAEMKKEADNAKKMIALYEAQNSTLQANFDKVLALLQK